jgi:hypothetical protein
VEAADPRAFEMLAETREFEVVCAMTGEARTAMPMAVMITFRLVFIVDLISIIVAPCPLSIPCGAPHKTVGESRICALNIVFTFVLRSL